MIVGTGIDITEVERISRLLEREGFAEKVFTDEEQEAGSRQKTPAVTLAGRFAAKEALMKALGTGWAKGVAWREIAITNDEAGKPAMKLDGKAREVADQLGATRIHLSISHTESYAVAQVILESE